MPSLSWVVTDRSWFDAAFPDTVNGELCAHTMVMLLYFRSQNSTKLLHGVVFVATGDKDDVDEAVELLGAVLFKVVEVVITLVPERTVCAVEEMVAMVAMVAIDVFPATMLLALLVMLPSRVLVVEESMIVDLYEM